MEIYRIISLLQIMDVTDLYVLNVIRPFNSLSKLIRHCREVHLKDPPRRLELHERSK